MANRKPEKIKPEDIWDYYIDDSKMPTPEQVASFADTSEIDKKFDKECDQIAREFGLYKKTDI